MQKVSNGNIHILLSEPEKNLPLYLTNVGKWPNQYRIFREKGWPKFQWLQCTKGRGLLKIRGEEYSISPGQGMLLYPNEFHEYYAISEPWEVHWFSFIGKQAADILKSLQFVHSQVMQLSDPEPILTKMDKMMKLAAADTPIGYLQCSTVIYEILIDLFHYSSAMSTRSRHQYFARLSPALEYIYEHYHELISLEDLAAQLSVTEQYTCTLFKQTLGFRPMEYVNKFRIGKARRLLTDEPELSIAEIALRVGYEDLSYFIKMFKRYHGTTPRKYREQM